MDIKGNEIKVGSIVRLLDRQTWTRGVVQALSDESIARVCITTRRRMTAYVEYQDLMVVG